MADNRFSGNKFTQSDFLQVLLQLEKKTMTDLHVSTLAYVQSIDAANKTVVATSFPLLEGEMEKNITCFCLNSTEGLAQGDIVFVIFCDKNFANNLRQIRQSGFNKAYVTDDKELHSEQFGVIVKTY